MRGYRLRRVTVAIVVLGRYGVSPYVELKLMNIVRWITFAWGGFAALVMAYYATQWAVQPHNPLRNEFWLGFSLGLVYGMPAWLGLPVLAYIGRQELSRVQLALLLSPIVLVLAATSFLGVISAL